MKSPARGGASFRPDHTHCSLSPLSSFDLSKVNGLLLCPLCFFALVPAVAGAEAEAGADAWANAAVANIHATSAAASFFTSFSSELSADRVISDRPLFSASVRRYYAGFGYISQRWAFWYHRHNERIKTGLE